MIVEKFENDCGSEEPAEYLTVMCRHAVAHAGNPDNADPDDYEKQGKLHVAAQILRELARHFIRTEMKLSEHSLDGI